MANAITLASPMALSRCRERNARNLRLAYFQATATAAPTCSADARKLDALKVL